MPLDWTRYDEFAWDNARQIPLSEAERDALERWLADLLALSAADEGEMWGSASPPGRFAATVVELQPQLVHRYADRAAAAGITHVGVKVFKTTRDGQRAGRRAVYFCREQAAQLPGWPNPRLQQLLDAGTRADPGSGGSEHYFLIQQWVPGETLDTLLDRSAAPLPAATAGAMLQQLFQELILPLWSVGTIWWDIRAANFCWQRESANLMLIDADSLAAYADEILNTPHVWTRREKGRLTAERRLRQLSQRIVQAQRRASAATVQRAFRPLWHQTLWSAFAQLGRTADGAKPATAAIQHWLAELAACDLLPAG